MSEIVIEDVRCITSEEFFDVAWWCNGETGKVYEGDGEGQNYIQVGSERALVGDWIVKTSDGFKKLSDEEYKKTFYYASKHRETWAAVLAVLNAAVADSYKDMMLHDGANRSMIAEAAGLRIMELVEKLH
jgi:hypothetical protein